jgi:hypothetical protein
VKQLLEAVKKRVSQGNGDASRRAEGWRGRHEARRSIWKEDALKRKEQKPIDTRWVTRRESQAAGSMPDRRRRV